METAPPPVSPSVVAAILMIQKPSVTSGTLLVFRQVVVMAGRPLMVEQPHFGPFAVRVEHLSAFWLARGPRHAGGAIIRSTTGLAPCFAQRFCFLDQHRPNVEVPILFRNGAPRRRYRRRLLGLEH